MTTSYTTKYIIPNNDEPIMYGIAASPDGTKVYVPIYNRNRVTVINAETDLSYATITVGSNPINIIFTRDGTKAYVANWGGNITVIDASNDSVLSTIISSGNNRGIALSPDEQYLYVTINKIIK